MVKMKNNLIEEEFEGKRKSFKVRVTDDCVYINTENNKLLLIIAIPDMSIKPHKDYDLVVYVADHASLFLRGTHKNKPELLLKSDEFSTKLQLDEVEGEFLKQIPFIVKNPKVVGYA